jgi:hypothetical protein
MTDESDFHVVTEALVKPNLAERLNDATAKPHPITFVTVPPVVPERFEASRGAALFTSIIAGEPSTIGAWAMKCVTYGTPSIELDDSRPMPNLTPDSSSALLNSSMRARVNPNAPALLLPP